MIHLTWSQRRAWNFVAPYLRNGHTIEVTVTGVRPLQGVCVLVGPAAEGMQDRVRSMSADILAALESGCVPVRRRYNTKQKGSL